MSLNEELMRDISIAGLKDEEARLRDCLVTGKSTKPKAGKRHREMERVLANQILDAENNVLMSMKENIETKDEMDELATKFDWIDYLIAKRAKLNQLYNVLENVDNET